MEGWMKAIYYLAAGALLVCSVIVLAQDKTATPKVDRRERRQQKRIEQGEKSGQLTPREARNLERRESKIQRDKAKAKSDGKVTPAERRKLNREENRTSRAIHRKKHNNRTDENPRGR
jgi:hypothetical protein